MTRFQALRRAGVDGRLSVADVYRLTEEGVFADDDRFELIDGEIVPMAAAKSNGHEKMKQALNRELGRLLPSNLGVFVETSITLDEHTYVEPDICIFDLKHDTREVRGDELLLVIEVASSSLGWDLLGKRDRYARFGARDYWVIDVERRIVRIHRNPVEGHYRSVDEFERNDRIVATFVPSFDISLASLPGL